MIVNHGSHVGVFEQGEVVFWGCRADPNVSVGWEDPDPLDST